MDTETGQIREFTEEEARKIFLDSKWEPLDKLPDPNCSICYGRGHIGYNRSTHKYMSCKCTRLR